MKKLLVGILCLTLLCCLAGCDGVDGENVTGITSTDNMVFFEPECPECGHIGLTESLNVCEGESYTGKRGCDKCFKIFDISIER